MTAVAEPVVEEKVDEGVLSIVSLPGRRVWSRAEFLRAHEIGLFTTDDNLELLKGEVFTRMTMQGPHILALYKSTKILQGVFEPQRAVLSQVPFTLNSNDYPEPDLAVLSGEIGGAQTLPPTSPILVIEISDATLKRDRTLKAAIYAEAKIPEYWILNLNDRVLEVHQLPATLAGGPFGFGYQLLRRYNETDSFSPLAAPEVVIAVSDLLP